MEDDVVRLFPSKQEEHPGMDPPTILLTEEDVRDLARSAFTIPLLIHWVIPNLTIADLETEDFFVWYVDGEYHREDGPALVAKHRDYEVWYRKGLMHRDDGPAVIEGDYLAWYRNGELLSEVVPMPKKPPGGGGE